MSHLLLFVQVPSANQPAITSVAVYHKEFGDPWASCIRLAQLDRCFPNPLLPEDGDRVCHRNAVLCVRIFKHCTMDKV